MAKRRLAVCTALMVFMMTAALPALAGDQAVLRVSGLVKQPLILSLDALAAMDQVRVKHNGITRAGEYQGVFWLEGVPLRSLLELAGIQKEPGGFHKLTDTALAVRDRSGRQVAVSWGEVMHRNPSEVVLALSARPVMPKKNCASCHKPGEYEPWMKQLDRELGFPKLVLTGDYFSDRSLEGVASVEVVSVVPGEWKTVKGEVHSPKVTAGGVGLPAAELDKLPDLPRRQVMTHQVGEGKGYHGRSLYGGYALRDLLELWKLKADLNTVFVVSAPDGYQSLVSYGELFLGPGGDRIMLADQADHKPIPKMGRFQFILPDDLWADRWVKAASHIQAASLQTKPRLTVIGMGCGDSDLLTLEAVSALARADVLVAPADISKRFAPYLQGKQVLFDPMSFGRKPFNKLGDHHKKESREQRREQQAQAAGIIRKNLEQGRSVAVLDWGDPMVYGSARWLNDFFPQGQIHFVPGLSAFNVGSAALARDITCKGAVVISDSFTLTAQPEILTALAKKGATLAVFMGLPKFEQVMAAVGKSYAADTPVNVVLKAGYGQGQRVLESDLGGVMELWKKQKEKWLGIIFVGPCLRPSPIK